MTKHPFRDKGRGPEPKLNGYAFANGVAFVIRWRSEVILSERRLINQSSANPAAAYSALRQTDRVTWPLTPYPSSISTITWRHSGLAESSRVKALTATASL